MFLLFIYLFVEFICSPFSWMYFICLILFLHSFDYLFVSIHFSVHNVCVGTVWISVWACCFYLTSTAGRNRTELVRKTFPMTLLRPKPQLVLQVNLVHLLSFSVVSVNHFNSKNCFRLSGYFPCILGWIFFSWNSFSVNFLIVSFICFLYCVLFSSH